MPEVADVITEYQKQLKSLNLKCLTINLSDLKLKVQKSFAISISKIAEGFITHDDVKNYASHQSIVDLLATNYDAVTCHLNILKADFIKLYCEVNEVESLPSPTGASAVAADTTHPLPPVTQ